MATALKFCIQFLRCQICSKTIEKRIQLLIYDFKTDHDAVCKLHLIANIIILTRACLKSAKTGICSPVEAAVQCGPKRQLGRHSWNVHPSISALLQHLVP